jgi:hypothetical protein
MRRVGGAERHGPILTRRVERIHFGLGAPTGTRGVTLQPRGIVPTAHSIV